MNNDFSSWYNLNPKMVVKEKICVCVCVCVMPCGCLGALVPHKEQGSIDIVGRS
jgi:hypothetical protein